MEKQTYFRVRVRKIPSNIEIEATEIGFEYGCSGISEVLSYVQKDLVYDPEIRPQRFRDVDVFFSERPPTKYFEALQNLSVNINWEIIEEEHKDWLEEWKKGFKPFPLVGPFWVVPSWFETPKEAEKPLFIDPGMAFGTGTHATTQMAAAFTHRIFKKKKLENFWQVIDVGTGTAILAMLARLSGAERVVGIDIDPEARRVARENVLRNKIESIEILETPLEEIRESFDVVIANIIDGVLLKLKGDLCRIMKHNGYLILTGVLEERENSFIDDFLRDTDLKIDLRLSKEEWVGYLISARDSSN